MSSAPGTTGKVGRKTLKSEPMARRLKDHYGFSTTILAQLLGISGWRLRELMKGEEMNDDEAGAVACLQSFCALVTLPFHVSLTAEPGYSRDPAAWFECRIVPECPLTPSDIWAKGRRDLCHELAAEDATEAKKAILDRFESGWQEHYKTAWEVYQAEDGEMSIRLKAGQQ